MARPVSSSHRHSKGARAARVGTEAPGPPEEACSAGGRAAHARVALSRLAAVSRPCCSQITNLRSRIDQAQKQ